MVGVFDGLDLILLLRSEGRNRNRKCKRFGILMSGIRLEQLFSSGKPFRKE